MDRAADDFHSLREYLAADHDGLMAATATLARLAADRRFDEAALVARGLRARFALHLAGTIETLGSLPLDTRPQIRALRAEQKRLETRFDTLDAYIARHEAGAVAASARRLQDFIDEHAARELVPLAAAPSP